MRKNSPSRLRCGLALATLGLILLPSAAIAQNLTLGFGETGGTGVTERAVQMVALITILSLAPSILIMVTSFTRIVVVLSLLRTAIGVQASPPNAVVVSLALFLTAFVMAPVFQAAYDAGVKPLVEEKIELPQAFDLASKPFQTFMLAHVREKDLGLFMDMSGEARPQTPAGVSLRVLVPAFMFPS